MRKFLTEDISISKKTFIRLFISYSLTFFSIITVVNTFILALIIRNSFPIWLFFIPYVGSACGVFLSIFFFKKNIRLIWLIEIIFGFAFFALFVFPVGSIPQIYIVGVFLIGGILIGGPVIQSFILLGITTKIEERGRIIGILNALGGIISLPLIMVIMFIDLFYQILIIGMCFIIIGCLNVFSSKDFYKKLDLNKTNIETKIERRDFLFYTLILFLICCAMGTGLIYMTFGSGHDVALSLSYSLFGNEIIFWTGTEIIMFFVSISLCVSSFFLGLFCDKFGRKTVWIIGLSSCIIGLFFLGFFLDSFFIIVASSTYGIATSAGLIGFTNFISDSVSSKDIAVKMGIIFGIGWLIGLANGVLLGVLISPYPITNTTLFIVFILGLSYFLIVYSKETLPSKKERKWFDKINHIYVITPSGIPLYNYSFKPHIRDAGLIAGGISGLCELIKELTMSESQLKVIKQEKANILINYGKYVSSILIASEELKILHKKLELFTKDFEEFFHDILKEWTGEVTGFIPTKVLIERIFEVQKFKRFQVFPK